MMARKKVLVSGASSGIGKATVERFAREGWDVCLTSRRQAEMESVLQTLPDGNHLIFAGDYSEGSTPTAIAELIRDEWGHLDALVNCAGVWLTNDAIDSPLQEWRRPFDIMVNGAIGLTRASV